MKTMICAAFGVIVLAGCAQPEIPIIEKQRRFAADYDTTWRAVIATVAEQSYPINAIEKDSGIVATEEMLVTNRTQEMREYAVLPSLPFSVWQRLTCRLNFFVHAGANDATTVQVNTAMRAYESNMTGAWHSASSTGAIETTVFESLRNHLHITTDN